MAAKKNTPKKTAKKPYKLKHLNALVKAAVNHKLPRGGLCASIKGTETTFTRKGQAEPVLVVKGEPEAVLIGLLGCLKIGIAA
jgi:hypothetical protein